MKFSKFSKESLNKYKKAKTASKAFKSLLRLFDTKKAPCSKVPHAKFCKVFF
jgi:hypothetical protein